MFIQELAMKFGPFVLITEIIFFSAFITSGIAVATRYSFKRWMYKIGAKKDPEGWLQENFPEDKIVRRMFILSTVGLASLTLIMIHLQFISSFLGIH